MMQPEIRECFCMWSDLLGFGTPFEAGGWKLEGGAALENLVRLAKLEQSLSRSLDPLNEVAFVLNDGLARVYDLPTSDFSSNQLLRWMHSAISHHWYINAVDQQSGNPGIRSVITFGQRADIGGGNKTVEDHVLRSPESESRDPRICVYRPHEFHLNLAFSKAYMIESRGKAAGIEGNGLYVEEESLVALARYLGSDQRVPRIIDPQRIDNRETFSLSVEPMIYGVSETRTAETFTYTVQGRFASNGSDHRIIRIEFIPDPIVFSDRGLQTRLWRVRKYYPIDEPEPFHFDFLNMRFGGTDWMHGAGPES